MLSLFSLLGKFLVIKALNWTKVRQTSWAKKSIKIQNPDMDLNFNTLFAHRQ